MKKTVLLFAASLLSLPYTLFAFPLDGAQETGIERLEGYRLAQQGLVPGNRLHSGAQLKMEQVQLRLQGRLSAGLPAVDPWFSKEVEKLLGEDAEGYSISLLDITDPDRPLYAEHDANVLRNPASVGKLVVLLALFQALADIYPDDVEARHSLLRDSHITADEFINSDHHKVPFWVPEKMRLIKRPVSVGDTGNFWTYLDWSVSASSNAATSMVMKHLLLLRHYGQQYPVTRSEEDAYFNQRSRKQLGDDLLQALLGPVLRNGMDTDLLRQGSFFSKVGKRHVAGTTSICTTRELMNYLLRMEQGRLVDAWSSLQIKRLLYITQYRIRYAYSPALKDAAVYFKSGSFYKCKPEEGYKCGAYKGNKLNLMNSVAVVEAPAGAPRLNYIVTITSNVLRKNSADEQQRLATRLHRLLQKLHPVHVGQQ